MAIDGIVSTPHGFKQNWSSYVQVIYIVETTRHDEEPAIDFENVHQKECATIGDAMHIMAEWQKAGYNNIGIMTQVKQGDSVIIEDTASDIYFSSPEDSRAQKRNRELVVINEELEKVNGEYAGFVEKFKARKMFEEYQKEMRQSNFDGKLYWYEMTLRGVSVGCQPRGFVSVDHMKGRHGIVGYDRELNESEIAEYEMRKWIVVTV